jgi:hypothetical protein
MRKAVANKRFRATISCRHLPEVLQLAGSHPAMDLGGLAAARGPDGLRLRPLSAMAERCAFTQLESIEADRARTPLATRASRMRLQSCRRDQRL